MSCDHLTLNNWKLVLAEVSLIHLPEEARKLQPGPRSATDQRILSEFQLISTSVAGVQIYHMTDR